MTTNELLAQLTNPDEDVRAEALEELNQRMDDSVAQALIDIAISDASDVVRGDSIIGLGPIIEEAGMDYDEEMPVEIDPQFGPGISREMFETVISEIRGLYEDEAQPKLVRRRAFEVLVRDPQSWQSAEIRRHFASSDEQWKITAVFAMGYVAGFDKEILATVQSGEDELLYQAVRAAGDMEVSAAAKRIREIATSENEDLALRMAAIEALPGVHADWNEILIDLAESDNEEIAEAAQETLDELSWDEPVEEE